VFKNQDHFPENKIPMSAIKFLTKRLTEPSTTLNKFDYLGHIFLFRDLKFAIQHYAEGKLLDIGCGNKPYLKWQLEQNCEVTGCDIEQSSERVVDIICPATNIPLPDNSFDTIFSSQVLEHVADHGTMLNECYRLLKPGGHLILSAPMFWEHHEEPYDFFRFTKYGFKFLLESRGFKIENLQPSGGKWALLGQIKLSNYNSFFKKRKGLLSNFFQLIYFALPIRFINNLIYRWLDKMDPDDSATLNYVVVASK
jgi:ubiquinone/menaquinone biosynthesis C-methylase UbiE